MFWLIDPLDGTKEFIKERDEFTINIALIKHNRPILGIIYAPALKVLYFAFSKGGSFKAVINDENMDIRSDFEFWMGQFNSHEYNDSTFSAANSGMGTFVITHNNREMSSGGDLQWQFENVFPVALGEIGLDWGSNDTIEEFTVDLAYDYWESSQTS